MSESREQARARRGRAGRWWPRLGVVAVLGLLVAGACFSQRHWSGTARVATRWEPVGGRVTPVELAAIASGAADGQEFAKCLREFAARDWSIDECGLEVRWEKPEGVRLEGTAYGWPTWIAEHSRRAQYQDVFTKSGLTPHDWGASYTEFWNSGSGSTGGAAPTLADEHWYVWAGPVALAWCYVLVGWYAGRGAAWLWARQRRTRVRRRWLAPCAGAGLALLAMAVGTLASVKSSASLRLEPIWTSTPVVGPLPPSFSTGWTVQDLRAALAREDGPRAAATAFLWALPSDPQPGLVVDVGVVMNTTAYTDSMAGFPSYWLTWGEMPTAGWTGVLYKPGLSINSMRRGQVSFARVVGVAGGTVRYWIVDGPALAIYAVMAWLAWHVPRGAVGLTQRITERRRRSRGRCAACGYDLAGLGAGPA